MEIIAPLINNLNVVSSVKVGGYLSRVPRLYLKTVLEAGLRESAAEIKRAPNGPHTLDGLWLIPEAKELVLQIRNKFPSYELHGLATLSTLCGTVPYSGGISNIPPGHTLVPGAANRDLLEITATAEGSLCRCIALTHRRSQVVQAVLSFEIESVGIRTSGLRGVDTTGYKEDPPIALFSPRISKQRGDAFVVQSKHLSAMHRMVTKVLSLPITKDEEFRPICRHFVQEATTKFNAGKADLTRTSNNIVSNVQKSSTLWAMLDEAYDGDGTAKLPNYIRKSITALRENEAAVKRRYVLPKTHAGWLMFDYGGQQILLRIPDMNDTKVLQVLHPNNMPDELRQQFARAQLLDGDEYVVGLGFRTADYVFTVGEWDVQGADV